MDKFNVNWWFTRKGNSLMIPGRFVSWIREARSQNPEWKTLNALEFEFAQWDKSLWPHVVITNEPFVPKRTRKSELQVRATETARRVQRDLYRISRSIFLAHYLQKSKSRSCPQSVSVLQLMKWRRMGINKWQLFPFPYRDMIPRECRTPTQYSHTKVITCPSGVG